MNTLIMIVAMTTFIMTQSLNAQEQAMKFPTVESRINYGKKNVLLGLRSNNNGVIEASLILIAKIKMDFPETNIADIKPIVDSIAWMHSSESIRYKAYITSNICADPQWFSAENMPSQYGIDQFFISASQRLQNKFFGINSH